MTPEKFIQDFWSNSDYLKASVPIARVITGDHNRMQHEELPCVLIILQNDGAKYHTSSKYRRKATVKVKYWGSFAQVIEIKNKLINKQSGIHRADWSGDDYVVSLARISNQFHVQEPDGEWQGVSDIELDYSLNS